MNHLDPLTQPVGGLVAGGSNARPNRAKTQTLVGGRAVEAARLAQEAEEEEKEKSNYKRWEPGMGPGRGPPVGITERVKAAQRPHDESKDKFGRQAKALLTPVDEPRNPQRGNRPMARGR